MRPRWGWVLLGAAVGIVILMAASARTPKPPPEDFFQAIRIRGSRRTYFLHVPRDLDRSHEAPLVLLLHGRGGRGSSIRGYTGMARVADREGFILACPNATGRPPSWSSSFYPGVNKPDDVGFLRALIDELKRQYPIDPRRVYVAGHSSGAMMAYRIGVELPDQVAAIGVVAGALGARLRFDRPPPIPAAPAPISVIVFHGRRDSVVPYEGGESVTPDVKFPSVESSINYFIANDRCRTVEQQQPGPHGNYVRDTYRGGVEGTEVVVYTILNGGHEWPGNLRSGNTPNEKPTNATELIWQFFKTHPKPEAVAQDHHEQPSTP